MRSAPCITERENCRVADAPDASETRNVKFDDPTVVGLPLSTPEDDRDSPGGRLPPATDHEYEGTPPAAASVVEYGTNRVACGRAGVETDNAAFTTI